ncbi:protein kinase [Kitasatospora sp. NPDC101801]|uniref:serine/threonine-protein kinase n=1 Tax=Kitasatospora sp. NPDC101801 TaxID=3364103 RepID=UPI00382F7155
MWGRGTVLGGRYTLTERIGGGGMGDVWRAEDEVLGRQVAVKVLHAALLEDEQFAERFRREARMLAALSHPGIVDVHDYGESVDGPGGQVAYIVMELIDGRPLHEVLAADGPLSAERTLGLLAGALDALHAAHQQDIVHRDIKPSNLMVRADDRVVVTDFGIATAATSTKITASHAVLGTALYMAPEQAEGAVTTPLSDLYSIGVVCYELLTGQVPFGGESVLEIVLKHVREPAPGLPPSFSPAVRQFVATALAKQPEHRYPDAATMAAAARAALTGTGGPVTVPATAVGTPPALLATPVTVVAAVGDQARTRPEPKRRRFRVLVPLIVPVVITAGAGGALLIDRSPLGSQAKGNTPSQSAPVVGGSNSATAPAGSSPPASAVAETPAAPASAPPADPNAGQAPANQPAGTVPNTGGGNAGGNAGGTGTGSGTGSGAGNNNGGAGSNNNGGGTPGGGGGGSNPAPTKPSPAPTTPPPAPSVPAECGGKGWSYVTGVGSGMKLGLAGDPVAGTTAVMGGRTEFGWMRSDQGPGGWYYLYPCNLAKPMLVQGMGDGAVEVNPDFSALTSWGLINTGSGSIYLKDYSSSLCMTDNGAGKAVTMQTCTPGNKSQQWRVNW